MDLHPHPASRSRWDRFRGGYVWLILKNVLGWILILAAFIAGPLVPGPGGIPLFLIGFALISFPGKRRLTARVLRGRTVVFQTRKFVLGLLASSVVIAGLALWILQVWRGWPGGQPGGGRVVVAFLLAAIGLAWLLHNQLFRLINLLLRTAPRVRRRIRPWLRRHHIHLLPPRRRRRLAHEPGEGPHDLGDEILKLGKS